MEKSDAKWGVAGLLVMLMTTPVAFAEYETLPYSCFEVDFPDGDRNSECVRREQAACERSMKSTRACARPGSVFKGCFQTTRVFCYEAIVGGSLCFTVLSDCEASQRVIPGGSCAANE